MTGASDRKRHAIAVCNAAGILLITIKQMVYRRICHLNHRVILTILSKVN